MTPSNLFVHSFYFYIIVLTKSSKFALAFIYQ